MNLPAGQWSILRKLVAVSGAAGVAWWACGQLIAPFLEREKEDWGAIAGLRERIGGARKTIEEIRALEEDAARARGELQRLQNELPAGSAMIWLPKSVKEHFARFGLVVAVVRLNTTLEEPGMPGYDRGYWSVGVLIDEANRNLTGLLNAVAELEQQHSFVKVLDFAIRPEPEDPDRRMAVLNVAALIRK